MSAKIPTGKNALFKPLFRFMREKRAGREKIRRNLQHWHFTARFRTLAPQTRSSIAEANCGNAWKRALWTGLKIHNASTLNSSVQPIENGDVAFTGNSRKTDQATSSSLIGRHSCRYSWVLIPNLILNIQALHPAVFPSSQQSQKGNVKCSSLQHKNPCINAFEKDTISFPCKFPPSFLLFLVSKCCPIVCVPWQDVPKIDVSWE